MLDCIKCADFFICLCNLQTRGFSNDISMIFPIAAVGGGGVVFQGGTRQ